MKEILSDLYGTVLDAIYQGKDFAEMFELLEEKYDIERMIASEEGERLLTRLYEYYNVPGDERHVSGGSFADTLMLREILFGSHGRDMFSERILSEGIRGTFSDDVSGCMIAAFRLEGRHLPLEAKNRIRAEFPGVMRMIRDDIVYLLFYRVNSETGAANEVSTLKRMAEHFGFHMGVSFVYQDLDHSSGFRRQAAEMMKLAMQKNEPLLRADDVYGEMILSAAIHDFSPSIFRLNEVKKLMFCDRVNGTDYERTLRVYLENSGRRSQTAQMLFVDRSTLQYRIKKIGEIIGRDPEKMSGKEMLRLLISLKINQL